MHNSHMINSLYTNVFMQVCKETRVQEITSNHDTSSINKRDATEQDTTTSSPCDLPEHKDEFPNFIFTYKSGVDLDAIKNSVEQLTENSAQVKSTTVLHFLDMIIFQMNREAYLQVNNTVNQLYFC